MDGWLRLHDETREEGPPFSRGRVACRVQRECLAVVGILVERGITAAYLHSAGTNIPNSTLIATLVPQIFLYSYRNFTKFDSGRVEGTNVMLHSLDKKEEEQNRASLKRIIDTTIFCGENEIPLRGHWATEGRKPFRKGGQFSSVARVRSN
ncbi:hypothetical protein J6590_078498 [Homalodisca vitripennis]|nr:hypothetical protein J6590_078498 [Homalodisca vitripennis]